MSTFEPLTYAGGITGAQQARPAVVHPHHIAAQNPTAFATVFAGSRYVEAGFFNTLAYALDCAKAVATNPDQRRAGGPYQALIGRAASRSEHRRLMAHYPDTTRETARRAVMERLLTGNAARLPPG